MEWKFSDFGYDKYLACFHGKLGVKKLTSYRLVGEEDNKNTTTITKYKLKLETCTQHKSYQRKQLTFPNWYVIKKKQETDKNIIKRQTTSQK